MKRFNHFLKEQLHFKEKLAKRKKKKEKRINQMIEMAKLMNPFFSADADPDYVIEVTNKEE